MDLDYEARHVQSNKPFMIGTLPNKDWTKQLVVPVERLIEEETCLENLFCVETLAEHVLQSVRSSEN